MAPEVSFTPGARPPAGADPQKVFAELERVRAACGGSLTAEAVLDAAKDEKSPLHQWFTWDDSEAARKHRLDEARRLVRSIAVSFVERPEEQPRTIRVYTSTTNGGSPGQYRTTEDVVSDPVLRKQAVERLLRELRSLRHKYASLSSFIALHRIEEIADEVEQAANEAERREASAG